MGKKITAFFSIFKDNNPWNEKNIIGFITFAIMVLVMIADVITGICGKELAISDSIYNSFLILVLGCFGISGIENIFNRNKNNYDE